MTRPRIMVVEDESIIAMDIRRMLEAQGYSVPATASSGEEAIAQASKVKPDLILMDIVLKGEMDGIEAAEEIRAGLGTPIIYLTAYADDETLQRARVTEPFGYLVKPFEARELRSAIEMALYKAATERELKENRQWLITTINSIGNGLIATDTDGTVIFMNHAAESLTGWTQAEASGKDVAEVFVTSDRPGAEDPVRSALRDGVRIPLDDQTVLTARDGREIPVDGNAAPIVADTGSVIGVVLAFRDITEQKAVEEELRKYREHLEELVRERTAELEQANQQLQQLLQYIEITERKAVEEWLDVASEGEPHGAFATDEGVITTDARGAIVLMNPAAEHLTGYRREEIAGTPLEQIFSFGSGDADAHESPFVGALTQGLPVEYPGTVVLRRKDGSTCSVRITGEPIRDAQETVIGMICTFHEA